MNERESITLYHGTRADLGIIRSEGLKSMGIEERLDKILSVFGISRFDPTPRWTWQWEQRYRRNEYKGNEVQLTTNKRQAIGYSFMGGEFEFVIGTNILRWKHPKWTPDQINEEYFRVYKPHNRVVVTAEVPLEWLQSEQQERIRAIKGLMPIHEAQYQVRLPYIPPENITSIEKVSPHAPH